MKKIILNVLFVAFAAIFLSGCAAFHAGYMGSSVALSSANFSYVKTGAKGEATATYIFGIGGLARATLVDDAKKDMLSTNPLKANQALANLTVNFKTSSFFGVYITNTCIVTADIVEFK